MQGGYQTLDLSGITLTEALFPLSVIDIGDFTDLFDMIVNCDKAIMTKMPKMLFNLTDTGIVNLPEVNQTYSCWIYNKDSGSVSTAIPLYMSSGEDTIILHLVLVVERSQMYATITFK